MAKNTVQFQRGMSMADFMAEYGAEGQCRAMLIQWRWPKGFTCPECGHGGHCVLRSGRFQCNACRRQTSPTSGTIFAGSKLPLAKWFLAMYLMTQSKTGVSAMTLMRFLGVTYNTAWLVKHKLMQTMKERDDRLPLAGHIQVDDAYLGGQAHDGSTGRGATRKVPMVAAVQCNLAGEPVRMRLSVVKGFRRRELKRWAKTHIQAGSLAITDGLTCFRGIADAGNHHRSIVTGGGHRAVRDPRFWAINTMLGNVKSALTGTYRAPSIAHAPRYLAEFCYRFNRRFRLNDMLVRLAHAAIATPPLPYRLAILAEHHG